MSDKKTLKPESLTADPAWHMFDFRVKQREFWFTKMTESHYNDSVFLDARIKTAEPERMKLPVQQVFNQFGEKENTVRSPLRFIFHTGHCGSTLLSRAFQDREIILPLREPVTLNTLSDLKRELGQPTCLLNQKTYRKALDVIVSAMSRRFRSSQHVVVKPTSTCNNLVKPLLDGSEESRALLLYQTLQRHVAGRIDSPVGIYDLYSQSRERMQDWMSIPDRINLFNAQLNPAQLAVLSWITSMYFLTRAARQFPQRAQLVEFDHFLTAPQERLFAHAEFLELGLSNSQLEQQWESVSGQYSKAPGRSFTAEDRSRKLESAIERHSELVERSLGFAEQLIERVPALEPVVPYLR